MKWLLCGTKDIGPEGQVARWLEVLGTYNFDIEHRPGRYHGNCDGLSRRPCEREDCPQCNRIERNAEEHPIHVPRRLPRPETSPERTHREDTEEIVSAIDTKTECNPWVENMSSTALREAQLEDPVIGELIKLKYRHKGKPLWEEISRWGCKLKEYWSNWELLHFKDGVLYRTWIEKVGGRHRELIVLPERLRNGPLRKLHDDKVAGHFGLIKTYLRIRERYFWVGFKIYVENWCRRCPVCVQKNKPSTSTHAPMKVYIVGAPMERVALDILGPLPLSEKGNKYILCAGDYFTKWVWAVALPNQEARTIAVALIENVFTLFGLPRIIHTDQGRNFESILFHELCQYFDIEKTKTTPYRPQSDGFIERFNHTLVSLLRSYTNENQTDWDVQIPFVIMAYRSSVQASTGYSPNQMMFGREVKLPIDLVLGPPPETYESSEEYIHELRRQIDKVHNLARENLKVSSSNQKQYDHRSRKVGFSEGDLVWYYCPARKKGLSPT